MSKEHPLPVHPRLVPGIYSESDVIRALGMRSDSLRKARKRPKNPLRPLQTGTRAYFYDFDDLLAFFKADPSDGKGGRTQ